MTTASRTIEPVRLAEVLGVRFRIGLAGELVRRNNAALACIRATDIRSPNGFVVQLDPSWRSIEATFVPDNFAGELIWAMGQADQAARHQFSQSAAAFIAAGSRIALRINGSTTTDFAQLPKPPWSKFDLKVLRMSDAVAVGGSVLMKEAGEVASSCLALILSLLPLEEDTSEIAPFFEAGLPEGAKSKVVVNKYERNPVNRAACIARYGAECNGCGFDFGKVYGPLGDGYIEVHHLVPVSKMGGEYFVDPIADLIPLCANCHSMVHRRDPPLTLDELKNLLLNTNRA